MCLADYIYTFVYVCAYKQNSNKAHFFFGISIKILNAKVSKKTLKTIYTHEIFKTLNLFFGVEKIVEFFITAKPNVKSVLVRYVK